jgi:hypothetical protein
MGMIGPTSELLVSEISGSHGDYFETDCLLTLMVDAVRHLSHPSTSI